MLSPPPTVAKTFNSENCMIFRWDLMYSNRCLYIIQHILLNVFFFFHFNISIIFYPESCIISCITIDTHTYSAWSFKLITFVQSLHDDLSSVCMAVKNCSFFSLLQLKLSILVIARISGEIWCNRYLHIMQNISQIYFCAQH